MSDDLERARAQRTTITCATCGGHDFLLGLTLAGGTMLVCVNHRDHVRDADLPAQRAEVEKHPR